MPLLLMVFLNILLTREMWAKADFDYGNSLSSDSSITHSSVSSLNSYPASSSFGTYSSSNCNHTSSSFGTYSSSNYNPASSSFWTYYSSPSYSNFRYYDSVSCEKSSHDDCSHESPTPPPTEPNKCGSLSSSSSSSSCIDICSSGSIKKPRSCLELKQRGYNTSGVYNIAPCDQRPCDVVEVYCDMDTDGGGWTVFQNRGKDTLMEFNRDFSSYRYGFGNAQKDFWLGNEYIHCLTSQTYTELMVVMQDWCSKILTEYYRCFYVSDWSSRFELRLKNGTEHSSTDSLMPHSNVKFSTHDQDTCNKRATQLGSGWWHSIPNSNLNGKYNSQEDSKYCCRERNSPMMNQTMQSCKTDGIFWRKWHGITYSLKKTTMMLRGRDPQDHCAILECSEIDTCFAGQTTCQCKPLVSENI